ncbi:MAG: hypothetical protein M1823_002588 [Watsoniomyces obsoletus]|nr:MAG: hypothetical protein M1823_002588 [Watsoniomyces obsoletus]
MDASAYLTRQGWRGQGHALHPAGHGLAHPLLLARKSDNRGVGKQKQGQMLADQWWSRAFDASLQTLQVGEKEKKIDDDVGDVPAGEEVEERENVDMIAERKTTGLVLREGGGRGLYAFFQKGDALRGTIGNEEETTSTMELPKKAEKGVRQDDEGRSEVEEEMQAAESTILEMAKTKKKRRRLRKTENDLEELVEAPPGSDQIEVVEVTPTEMAMMKKIKRSKKAEKRAKRAEEVSLEQDANGEEVERPRKRSKKAERAIRLEDPVKRSSRPEKKKTESPAIEQPSRKRHEKAKR